MLLEYTYRHVHFGTQLSGQGSFKKKSNGKDAAELKRRACIMIAQAQIIIRCKSLEMFWIEMFTRRIIRSPEQSYLYIFVIS